MQAFLTRPDRCKLFYTLDDFTDPRREPETVLFVHGLAESTEAWRAWVPYFAQHFRGVRVDARGFGRSTPMPKEYEWTPVSMPPARFVALVRNDFAKWAKVINATPMKPD